jgi:hypothetical protein
MPARIEPTGSAMASQPDIPEIKLDPASLYREEVFTDRRTGTVRRMTPVTAGGADDPSRAVLFAGQTQLLTPAGVLPLTFEIEAKSLEEALQKFPDGVKVALEQAIEEAREMRREASSRIVVPEVGAAVGPGPGAGGGKIKFP